MDDERGGFVVDGKRAIDPQTLENDELEATGRAVVLRQRGTNLRGGEVGQKTLVTPPARLVCRGAQHVRTPQQIH